MKRRRRARRAGDTPVVPDATIETPAAGRAPDDEDLGWGELPAADADEQLRRDRPPHHDGRSSW